MAEAVSRHRDLDQPSGPHVHVYGIYWSADSVDSVTKWLGAPVSARTWYWVRCGGAKQVRESGDLSYGMVVGVFPCLKFSQILIFPKTFNFSEG